ncbi:MAG: ATP-binding protein, partial [Thermodesulfovibrionales bacterium]
VFKNGHHSGTIFFFFRIDDIGKRFLTDIKSGTRGYAWMMDDRGYLLYHPTQPDMVGKNLYMTDQTCFKCHRSFEVEKRILLEEKGENFGVYVAPTGEDKVLAYSTADIGSSKWIIAVSAPYSEVTLAIQRSMKLYSWLIISIFATTTIVTAMLIVMNRKRVQAEERARHQEELERYAENLEKEVAIRTKELSTEKEKLNTIVNAMGSGIVLLNKEGKIEWANQKMEEIAGIDITGKYCEEVCADCTIVSSYSEKNMQTEVLSNLFGERDKYFQITTAPIKDEKGEVHGYIRLVQDVTEMKKMEEQMMHSEKMASLGRLTAGIAHEIGNPLTSVFSFVQILKEMEQDEFKKESLETIYFHIGRIADILKQLSGFSKMPPLEFKSWNINGLIESALTLIQYDKRAKGVMIVKELAPDIPEIITDGNQLSQVFINIILNAFDAMPKGGTLTLRSFVRDGHITIEFVDTGLGIPKENLSRIFDPFYTTKERGTGLGLAVSYSIIKKLDGSLTVESEPNKGTKFRITLPVDGVK